LIDIGTLRADHLGCYGYNRDTSPNIDDLARDSVHFKWAFSQAPTTAPSQASIMTGLYPGSHGMASEKSRLPEEATTLAESLADHGYLTAAFVDGGYLSEDFGFAQGFSTYDNSRGGGLAEIGPKVTDWLRQHASVDFLLLIHSYDAHTPYAPPERYRAMFADGLPPPSEGFEASAEQLEVVRASADSEKPQLLPTNDLEYAKALYDGGIRYVDHWIGRLMATIRELGLDERATIVLVSDHGEEFQEHGSVLHDTLYSTVTRVPLILRLPNGQKAKTVPKFVETVDLMPTLLDLAGAPPPPGLQGESLVPLILDQGAPPYLAFGESALRGGQSFVALGGYRMLRTEKNRDVELYNLLDDPLELEDLSEDEPDRIEVLTRRLDDWRRTFAASALREEAAPTDEKTLQQLRSLGYIQ
jgi:arylsulfatase A-like enzyme